MSEKCSCFFSKEVNYCGLQQFGATVSSLKDNGKDVAFSFNYRVLDRISSDDLFSLVKRTNPGLNIRYSKDTLGDVSQVHETEAPMWDFEVSDDGRNLFLRRS